MRKFWLVGLLALICSTAYAQTAKPRFKISVGVSVTAVRTADKTSLEASARSFLERELRSLGDVDLADAITAQHSAYLNVMEVHSKTGSHLSYAVTYSLIEWKRCEGRFLTELLDNGLYVTSSEGLRKTIEDIVVDIDNNAFAKLRKSAK